MREPPALFEREKAFPVKFAVSALRSALENTALCVKLRQEFLLYHQIIRCGKLVRNLRNLGGRQLGVGAFVRQVLDSRIVGYPRTARYSRQQKQGRYRFYDFFHRTTFTRLQLHRRREFPRQDARLYRLSLSFPRAKAALSGHRKTLPQHREKSARVRPREAETAFQYRSP